MTSRVFIGTCYNYTGLTAEETWVATGATYLNGQEEVCPTTQKEHLQVKVWLPSAVRMSHMIKKGKGFDWTPVGKDNCPDYAIKEKTRKPGCIPFEFGTKVKNGCDRKSQKARDLRDMTDQQLLDSTPYVAIQGRKIRQLFPLNNQYEGVRTCLWLWGPSGCGKTRWAHTTYPNAYLKAQNKWFDGYQDEEVVILDDVDSSCLGHYLKIWADRYRCSAESKGAKISLNHKTLIVTSNYSIEQLFEKEPIMIEPLKRRFTEIQGFNGITANNENYNDILNKYIQTL